MSVFKGELFMFWFYFMFIIVYGFDVSNHLVYCFVSKTHGSVCKHFCYFGLLILKVVIQFFFGTCL